MGVSKGKGKRALFGGVVYVFTTPARLAPKRPRRRDSGRRENVGPPACRSRDHPRPQVLYQNPRGFELSFSNFEKGLTIKASLIGEC